MKKLFLGLLITAFSFASPRTVNGPLQNPSNTGANGTVTVEWQTFTAGDGSLVVAGARTTTVTSGTYSQTFEPTSDASPVGVTYKVTYKFGSSSPAVCYWSIPAGSSAVLIANIQTCSTPSAPAGTIALSQLGIGGGSAGQCAIISGGAWTPNACTGSWTINGNDIYNSNTANVGIGGTPGSFNLDITGHGSVPTLRLYNPTSSQSTLAIIKASPTQISGVNPFVQVTNNSDVVITQLSSAGAWESYIGGNKVSAFGNNKAKFNSTSGISWCDGLDLTTCTADTFIFRTSTAGLLEIVDGSLAYQDLILRYPIWTGTTSADSKLANSQCTVILTTNTNLQFRCKGSDATVRTASLTLN